jgi:hypothetical protein
LSRRRPKRYGGWRGACSKQGWNATRGREDPSPAVKSGGHQAAKRMVRRQSAQAGTRQVHDGYGQASDDRHSRILTLTRWGLTIRMSGSQPSVAPRQIVQCQLDGASSELPDEGQDDSTSSRPHQRHAERGPAAGEGETPRRPARPD